MSDWVRSGFNRLEYCLAEALEATLVTSLFLCQAWLGAASIAWGIGFIAIGAAIDWWRWRYRYDWGLRRFVPNDWNGRDLLQAVEKISDDKSAIKKMMKIELSVGLIIWATSTIFLYALLISDSIFSDELFCGNSQIVQLGNNVALHLVEAVRYLPAQLADKGYACRSEFIEIFYSAAFYAYTISFVVFAVFYSHNSQAAWIAKGMNEAAKLDTLLVPKKRWSALTALALFYSIYALFFYFSSVDFEHSGKYTWNIHESNFQLFVMVQVISTSMVICKISIVNLRMLSLGFQLRATLNGTLKE